MVTRPAKKSAKAAPKKTAPKKTAPKKAAPKKAAPKKAASKKTAPKKTAPKKTASKQAASKQAAPKKSTLKTQANAGSVDDFLSSVDNPQRRQDARALCALMADVTGEKPRLWGPAIVGFGEQSLVYESGRVLDWFAVGFSPRKQDLTLYLTPGFAPLADLLPRLGPHSTGKSCLYVKRLDDVDQGVLREMVKTAVAETKRRPRA